jgi:hypothetical protein
MSDIVPTDQTPPAEPDATIQDDKQPTIDTEAITARLDKLEEENKRLRGSVSAKDKEIGTLKKTKSELEKQGMSEAEKAKAEALEEKAQALEEKKTYLAETKNVIVETYGLDDDTASLLTGETGEEIKNKAAVLKKFKESAIAEQTAKIEELEKEIKILKGNIEPPGRGNTQTNTLSEMSDAELQILASKDPSKVDAVLAEISARNKKLGAK